MKVAIFVIVGVAQVCGKDGMECTDFAMAVASIGVIFLVR